jgi:hypothetical protein
MGARLRRCGFVLFVVAVYAVAAIEAQAADVIRVGPRGDVRRIAEAAGVARSGDTVEIEAGEYVDDVAVWPQDRLTIRAQGGLVQVRSQGAAAQGKALWVISGTDVVIEGISFSGARVPDRNGAGIRHQGGRLTVRRCRFEQNEMGILTANDARSELVVEASEFRRNRVTPDHGDDIGHQIYVGAIGRFRLTDSIVEQGAVGHLVKSRARWNYVLNNRLIDGPHGSASYELEFPNGGVAYVVGNVIQQGPDTQNRALISFGAEGYRWPENALYLVHNTLVDQLPAAGRFVYARSGATRIEMVNNLLVGAGTLETGGIGQFTNNPRVALTDVAAADKHDYRVRSRSPVAGTAVDNWFASEPTLSTMLRDYLRPSERAEGNAVRRTPGALQQLAD